MKRSELIGLVAISFASGMNISKPVPKPGDYLSWVIALFPFGLTLLLTVRVWRKLGR